MSQLQGKELIWRLAWLVFQDQEHYKHQLENAVRKFFYFFQGMFSSMVFIANFHTRSRELTLDLIFFQGFSSQEFTSTEAACIILACELRTGKNFTLEDIQSGKLEDHLLPEDYDLEQRVCILHYLHCSRTLQFLLMINFCKMLVIYNICG